MRYRNGSPLIFRIGVPCETAALEVAKLTVIIADANWMPSGFIAMTMEG
jgi:hypothetical protein